MPSLHRAVDPLGRLFVVVIAVFAAVFATVLAAGFTVFAATGLLAAVVGAVLFAAVFEAAFDSELDVVLDAVFDAVFVVFDTELVLATFDIALAFLLPLALFELVVFAAPPPHANASAASETSAIKSNSRVLILLFLALGS